MRKTLSQVKAAPLSPNVKGLVQKLLPSIPSRDIDEIYKNSSEERKKKKEEEEKNKF